MSSGFLLQPLLHSSDDVLQFLSLLALLVHLLLLLVLVHARLIMVKLHLNLWIVRLATIYEYLSSKLGSLRRSKEEDPEDAAPGPALD